MSEDVYHESEVCTVRWDDDLGGVLLRWRGYASGEDYRTPMDVSLELLEERDGAKMLTDSREMGSITDEDKQWILEDWFPRAIQSGLSYSATVTPESATARMSLDKVKDLAEDEADEQPDAPIGFVETESLEEAREWLQGR